MRKKIPFNDIKSMFESAGFTLLSESYCYRNNHSMLNVMCSHGHKIKMSYSNFRRGIRCALCLTERQRIQTSKIKEIIEGNDSKYVWLDTYYKRINHTRLPVKCMFNHIFRVTLYDWIYHKKRCPICKQDADTLKLKTKKIGNNAIISDIDIKNENREILDMLQQQRK